MSELKAINAHGVRKDDGAYYDRRQADEYIAELDERHTTEITALEVSYRLQLDGLRYDKDAEIRRLKRALWLARALALSRFDVDEYLRKYTHCNSRFWNDGFNSFNEACKQMQKAINIAEVK